MPTPGPEKKHATQRVLILSNARAGPRGRGHLLVQLTAELQSRGFHVDRFHDFRQLARSLEMPSERPFVRTVVAAGGDGTVSAVVNVVPAEVPLTILPLGTENLLARYLRMPAHPQGLCDRIERGRSISVDAGRANGRLFLLMVGCGFDAAVVDQLHRNRRGHIRHWSYAKPILQSLRSYEYPEMRVFLDDEERPLRVRWAFVANLPPYAGGLRLAPDACGNDGRLDLCAFRRGSTISGMRYLAAAVIRQHRIWPDCLTCRIRRLRIEADEEVPFQLDGDPGGCLPVEIEALPGRVRFLVEPDWADAHGFA